MNLKKQRIKTIFSSVVILSILLSGLSSSAQDIIPTSDLVTGNSIFIFRGSSKKPQLKSAPQFFLQESVGKAPFSVRRPKTKAAGNRRPKTGAAAKKQIARRRAAPKAPAAPGARRKRAAAAARPAPPAKTAPAGAQAALSGGLLHLKRNENEAALADLARAVTLAPDDPEVYFYQAEALDRLGRGPEMFAAYRSSLALDPGFAAAWFDLAAASYNRGRYEEAAAAYRKVIGLDAARPDAHANLASAYRQLGQYAAANAEYKIAADGRRGDVDLFSEWGFCLGKVDEWDKAIQRLATARDLSPDAIDHANLGWALYNAARRDDARDAGQARALLARAREALERAAALDPRLDAALFNLGAAYTESGDYQNAVKVLGRANELRQNWALGINELGVAYRRSGDMRQALDQFQRAVALDQQFGAAYFNLGEVQHKLGRKKDARKTLDKLKQVDRERAARLETVLSGKTAGVSASGAPALKAV